MASPPARLQVSPQDLLLQPTVPIATIHTVTWPATLPGSQSHSPWQRAASSANTVGRGHDESAALSDCAKANQNQRCSHTHRRRRRHVSLLPMALAARFLATADLRASDFTSELWYESSIDCLWNRLRLPAVKLPLLPSILLLHAPSAPAPLLPSICISQAARNSPTCIYTSAVSQHLHLHLAHYPIIGARRLSDRLTS